jgi:Protein of unknown function (DUF2809)
VRTIGRRIVFLALAFATIAIGLVVHFRGAALGAVARDAFGDALWAMMIAWWAGVVAPRAAVAVRSVAAYAVCAGVEVSQLYHTPVLDAARATTLGQLVLGSGFDPRDLAAYGAGVALAAFIEWTAVTGRTHRRAAI